MALMQAKGLRKVIGAMKDQTTISIAKVAFNHADLEVAIVKATGHDELPSAEKYVQEILYLTSCSREYVETSISCLHKRLSKTKDWVVALKTLILCHRLLRDGDPSIERELVASRKRGKVLLAKVCDTFCDEYSSQQSHISEFYAFVSSYGLYLEERLDSSAPSLSDPHQQNNLLKKPYTHPSRCDIVSGSSSHDLREYINNQKAVPVRHRKKPVRKMKPYELMEKFPSFLRLLERILSCRPSGSAKLNNLVLSAIHLILAESFLLYKDIKDGMAILLDGFFDMEQCDCISAFDVYSKTAKGVDELVSFYSFCKTLGFSRSIEYPSVEKISVELLETMEASLKLRANSSARSGNSKRSKNRPQARSVRFKDQVIVDDIQENHDKNASLLPSPSTVLCGEEKSVSKRSSVSISASMKGIESLPKESTCNGDGIVDLIDIGSLSPSEIHENSRTLALFDGVIPTTNVNTSWEAFSNSLLNIDERKNEENMTTSERCENNFNGLESEIKVNASSWETFSNFAITLDERKGEGNTASGWELALLESDNTDVPIRPAIESLTGGFNFLLLDNPNEQGKDKQSMEITVPNQFPSDFSALPSFVSATRSMEYNHDPFIASLNIPPPPYVQIAELKKQQQFHMQEEQQWPQYQQQGLIHGYSSYNNPFLLNPYQSTVDPVHYYGTNSYYP